MPGRSDAARTSFVRGIPDKIVAGPERGIRFVQSAPVTIDGVNCAQGANLCNGTDWGLRWKGHPNAVSPWNHELYAPFRLRWWQKLKSTTYRTLCPPDVGSGAWISQIQKTVDGDIRPPNAFSADHPLAGHHDQPEWGFTELAGMIDRLHRPSFYNCAVTVKGQADKVGRAAAQGHATADSALGRPISQISGITGSSARQSRTASTDPAGRTRCLSVSMVG